MAAIARPQNLIPHNRRGSASNIWVLAGLFVWVEQDKMQKVISIVGITNPP